MTKKHTWFPVPHIRSLEVYSALTSEKLNRLKNQQLLDFKTEEDTGQIPAPKMKGQANAFIHYHNFGYNIIDYN